MVKEEKKDEGRESDSQPWITAATTQ